MKPAVMFFAWLLPVLSSAQENSVTTILFSPITPEYVTASAAEWRQTGFGGFLISNIMHNWDSDVWATDGDPKSRDESDLTLQRCLRMNEACAQAGIHDNFIKVAFYSHLPGWFDDEKWSVLLHNFKEAGRFARLAQFRGIAVDIEYISEMYDLTWKGYEQDSHHETDLLHQAYLRGRELTGAILEEYPESTLLTLPEALIMYGPLAHQFIRGMIEEAAQREAPGGIHIMTENSYKECDTLALLSQIADLSAKVKSSLNPNAWDYWKQNGSIVIGGWPLGYYRPIHDEEGAFLGWSGKKSIFGDQIVGSYADKSSNYSPLDFARQYSFMNSFTKRYNWIYGHGATWWHLTEEEARRYGEKQSAILPCDPQLQRYKKILAEKPFLEESRWIDLAEEFKIQNILNLADRMGMIRDWRVIGPFANEEGPPNRHTSFAMQFPPEFELDFSKQYQGKYGEVSWEKISCNPYSGYVDVKTIYPSDEFFTYYAACTVDSSQEKAAQLRIGSNDGAAVWLGARRIFECNAFRTASLDQNIIPIALPKGKISLLLKIAQAGGGTGFYARITDDDGEPIEGVQYSTE